MWFGIAASGVAIPGFDMAVLRCCKVGWTDMPRSRTRSSSLPQYCAVTVARRVCVGDSTLPPSTSEPARLNFAFLTPRSRMKLPMTMALVTPAAAKTSKEAKRERNCWDDLRVIVAGTRYAVRPTRPRDRAKSRTSEILRFSGISERMTIGIGKATRVMSVTMSQTPMAMSCAMPSRQCGPGSGVTCQ